MTDDFSLSGQHALITGGTRGIGLAIAETFAAAGAKLTLCSRTAEHIQAAVQTIERNGGVAHGVAADVGSSTDIARLVDVAESQMGPVAILVNNAATNSHF